MKKLETLVFEALGEASMCWSETPNGVFQDSKAKEIGDRLLQALTSVKSESVEEVLEQKRLALIEYIKLKHTQDECIGFIDGYDQAMHDFANNSEAMKREYQRAVCVYSDQHRAEFEYRRTEHLNPIVTSYSARAGQYEVGRVYIIKIIRD